MIGEMQLITSFCTSSPVALHVVFLFLHFIIVIILLILMGSC